MKTTLLGRMFRSGNALALACLCLFAFPALPALGKTPLWPVTIDTGTVPSHRNIPLVSFDHERHGKTILAAASDQILIADYNAAINLIERL